MRLIFLRHGIAEKKHENDSNKDDFQRTLTKEGIEQTKLVISSCRKIFKNVSVIYSSPLSRAIQTADILYKSMPKVRYEILSALDKFSDLQDFQKFLKTLNSKTTYCFVGHEPHLTSSIERLLGKAPREKMLLEKSGILILEGRSLKDLKLTTIISPKIISKIRR